MRLTQAPLLLVFSAALALTLHTTARAESTNPPELLVQYDFEKIPTFIPGWGAGYGSTYKPATGWHAPFKVTLDNEDPHSGNNALRFELLEVPTNEIIVHSPAIILPELASGESRQGERVIIHAYVRAKGISDGEVGLRVLEKNKDGKSLGLLKNQKSLVSITETPEWTELTVEGTLRSDAHSIVFMLVSNTQQVPATIYLDDISIEFAK
jgi:hypothetical protein